MTSKIDNNPDFVRPHEKIDFSKKILVKTVDGNRVILTSGIHLNDMFSGTIVHDKIVLNIGVHSEFKKKLFVKFDENLQVMLR